MTNRFFRIAVSVGIGRLLCSLLLVGLPLTVPAQIKCWQNDKGETECGSTVPPEYVKTGHKELNEQGLTVNQVDRELTDEELVQRQEQRKQDEIREKAEKEQDIRDLVLIQTYTDENEIIRSRDDKIGIIEGQIKLAESRIERLEGQVEFSLGRINAFKQDQQEVPAVLEQKPAYIQPANRRSKNFDRTKAARTGTDPEQLQHGYTAFQGTERIVTCV